MKRIFQVQPQPPFATFALLLLRVVVGAAFILHGWQKIQAPFEWMGPEAWAPGWLQALAAISEFGGGIAIVLGLLTPLGALGILCVMSVALYTHIVRMGDPFVPGWELPATYFCTMILLMAAGPGPISLDHALFGRRK